VEQPCPFRYVELYDRAGRHLGDTYPPLAEDNVLTQPIIRARAAVVVSGLLLDPADAHNDIGFVWMLPLHMSPAVPIPDENAAALVQASTLVRRWCSTAPTMKRAAGSGTW